MGFKYEATSVQVTRLLQVIIQKTTRYHKKEENITLRRITLASIIREIICTQTSNLTGSDCELLASEKYQLIINKQREEEDFSGFLVQVS